ncbi:MAG: restriction endonuclease subunit S, partial [Fibrobacter sp.]|nr:restriction endonuclease subunit S [Fibrobacter sp.]
MKAYKKYKDSGVSWIGMVPEHFEIIRLKFLLNTPMQYGANESGSLSSKNAVRYVRITDITNDGVLKNDDENVYLELDKAKNYLLKNKDILFARSGGTVGKSFMYKEDYGECSFAGYLIKAECNQNKFIPEFLLYYTQSSLYEVWKNLIFIQSTIQNIGANKYSNMEIPVPMLNEQEAIVRYLDQKVGQIDGYVAAKEKQLELLDELKQKIIADAVTGKCPEAMGLGRTPQYKPTN